MTLFPIQPSFSRGELSPRLHARVDIEYYKTGLAVCSNFYVLRQGGVRRRPGTRYIATARDHDRTVVRPFVFLVDQQPQVYAIEFGDNYCRFHTRNGTVFKDGAPYEIVSPWSRIVVQTIQIKQIGDTIRVTHSAVAPMTLRRYGETDWRILPVIFEDGPYQDAIADGTVLTPSSNGGIIQGVTSQVTPGLGRSFASSRFVGDIVGGDGGGGGGGGRGLGDIFNDVPDDSGGGGGGGGGGTASFPYPAWQAFDANGNTEWMARDYGDGSSTDEYLGYEFETPKIVTGYVLASSPREEQYVETQGESSVIYKIPGSLRAPRSWVFEGTNGNILTGQYNTLDQQANITGWGDGERRYFTFVNVVPYKAYRIRIVEVNASTSIARPVSIGTLKFSTGGADIGVLTLTASSTAKINNGSGFLPKDTGRLVRFLSEDAYWHWMRIINVDGPVAVDVEMHSPPLPSTNGTVSFQMGAFGNVPGWPSRVGAYQNRIVYARTNDQPQSFWLSRTDDYDSFTTTIPAKADDALSFTIAESGQINWILEGSDLLLGTEIAVRNFGAASANEGFSATNFKQGKPIRTGSREANPSYTGVAALFIGRLRNAIHELTYDFSVDGYVAPDVAVLSDHLLRGGIAEMAYAYQPGAVLWAAMQDGSLVAMTYEREQKMVALTQHHFGGNGKVESVCVIPGDMRDEVWFTVNRGQVRTIEILSSDFEGPDSNGPDTQADAFYVDCGLTYSGAPTATVTGLPDALRGKTVSILADGTVESPAKVATNGTLALPSGTPASKIQIGLGYESKIQTLRLAEGGRDGSGLGRKKVLKKVFVDVLETGDLRASAIESDETPQQLIQRSTDDTMGDAVPLYTGSLPIRVSDRWGNGGRVVLQVKDPLPCTILAISPGFEAEP